MRFQQCIAKSLRSGYSLDQKFTKKILAWRYQCACMCPVRDVGYPVCHSIEALTTSSYQTTVITHMASTEREPPSTSSMVAGRPFEGGQKIKSVIRSGWRRWTLQGLYSKLTGCQGAKGVRALYSPEYLVPKSPFPRTTQA